MTGTDTNYIFFIFDRNNISCSLVFNTKNKTYIFAVVTIRVYTNTKGRVNQIYFNKMLI